jgi:hypothetical protein
MTAATPTGPLPLVVAVTGHRDIRPGDAAALADRVRQLLQQLTADYPHSRIEVLSSLAEGADRLVAHVALDLDLRLIAALPLPADEYKKDFANAASIAEFDALSARASACFVVRGPGGCDGVRPECYARLGAYFVTHCHVLLALWNGVDTNKQGGTAETVRFRLEGLPPMYAGPGGMLDPIDTGLVHQIVTPRQSDATTIGEPLALRLIAPERDDSAGASTKALSAICASTDRFNALAAGSPAEANGRQQSEERLLPGGAGLLDSTSQALRALYGCADELASRFQRRTLRLLSSLFWIVFIAIVAFEVFADETPDDPGTVRIALFAISAYVACLALAYGLSGWGSRRELDKKYLDYRALAEGVRVQFYWRVAGISDSVADYHLSQRLQEAEWVRLALRSCELSAAEPDSRVPDDAAALQQVVRAWVQAQHQYFRGSVRRDEKRLEALERRAAVLAWCSAALGVIVIALLLFEGAAWGQGHEGAYDALVSLIGLSSTAAALVYGYVERRALSAHIKRYTRMSWLFHTAHHLVEAPMTRGEWPAVRRVLHELGREALEENADWLMLHRDRPIEVPQ